MRHDNAESMLWSIMQMLPTPSSPKRYMMRHGYNPSAMLRPYTCGGPRDSGSQCTPAVCSGLAADVEMFVLDADKKRSRRPGFEYML